MKKLFGICVVAACVAMGATVVAATGTAGRHLSESPAIAHTRSLYQARTLADSSGRYNAASIQSAVRARHKLLLRPAQPRSLGPHGPVFAAASAPAINWTEIGPGNVGGRINTIWVDPSNNQHLIVGAAGGGLWQSLDGGTSWTAIADFPGTLAVGAFAQVSSTVFLAGTGDQFNEPQPGIGMVASTDGGSTWTPIGNTAPSASNPDWYYVNSISVSSVGVSLAATGSVFCTNGDLLGTSELGCSEGGIWRSTDNGQTWAKVWPTAGAENPSLDVVFDPNAPNDAVADTEMGTVVYSTDAGQTWTAATGLPAQTSFGYRVSLAYDPSTAGSVYALVDNAPNGGPSGEVFHSTTDGQSWALLSGPGAFVNQHSGTATGALCDNSVGGPLECQGDYDNVVAVFPQGAAKPPMLFAEGVDVFASTDGGTTWTEAGSWLPGDADYIHADHHAFAASSSMYFDGNDGGMYELPVGSSSYAWAEINSGLAVTQFYRIDGHNGVTASSNGGITPILAGSQDNGMQLYEGYSASGAPQPDNWVPFFGGDGVGALVDPVNGNFLYGSYVYLDMTYSLSGGPSGQFFGAEPPDNTASPSTANFISPMKLIPNGTLAATEMLAGGASLWLGTNIQSGTPAWSSLNGTTLPVSTSGNYINVIEIDPNNSNNVWLGYDDGAIWHTINAGTGAPTWSQITSPALPTNQQVTDIWVVPGQSNSIYVTLAGFPSGADNIFASTDGGTTWQGIGGALPPGPVYSLVTDPNYPQILYVGTLTGVYTSPDNGQTWSTSNVGPANISVNQLTWFSTGSPPILLAATDGRGAWMGSPAYNPTPALTSIAPTQVTAGAGTTIITLTGTGFVSSSAVDLDGTAIAATYVSSTELQVSLTASQLAQAGTHTFTVVNPVPGGGTSAGATFTVVNPLPAISSLSPAQVLVGAGVTTVTLTGTGFVSGSTVNLDGTAIAATYVSATELQVSLTASQLAQTGTHTFTVTNPAPGGGTSAGATFTVVNPAPVISSLSPATAQAGSAGFTLTITGTGFVSASSVLWNSAALPTTFNSATELTAAVPASDVASAGAASITVTNPAPGGGTSAGSTFTVSANNGSGSGGGGGSSGGGGGGAQSALVLLLLAALSALKKRRNSGQP